MFLCWEIWQANEMGKRSGVPHRDDELAALSLAEIEAELQGARATLKWTPSAKGAKAVRKRIYWLEAELARRD